MVATFESYTTEDGDSVDLIAFRRFGSHDVAEEIWDANPGLAAQGPALPAGMVIRIPLPVKRDRVESVNIWS